MVNSKAGGKVITFYSYKGGVGRSMAMANIGVILAQWGFKTLLIDWDLEAPGLENYYHNFLNIEDIILKQGLINLLTLKLEDKDVAVDRIDWQAYISPVIINNNSNLHLITAGKRDENYIRLVREFDFTSFYSENDGGQYLEDIREAWLDRYDFVLIDSRTGLTDSSGICSIHMPDILVLLFTPNEQSFNGIKNVAKKAIEGQKQIIFDRFRLRAVPIPSRIENAETILLDEWLQKIYSESDEMLEWLPKKPENMSEYSITPAQLISQIKIPYKSLYAYGERLAVIERGTSDPQDLGYVYETIAAILANDLQDIHLLDSSRDNLVKKAKGEDIVDHSELMRTVVYEKEEKSKLEAQLRQKELHEEELKKAYSKKRQRLIAYSVLAAFALVFIIFILVRKTGSPQIVQSPTATTDSLAAAKTYADFVTSYTTSSQQYDLNFNLDKIKQYYTLDKDYQDTAAGIKKQIENAITYKFHNLADSGYYAIRKNPSLLNNYLADSLTMFGKQKNIQRAALIKSLLAYTKSNIITNKPVDSTFSLTSDSSGFTATFVETGNVLLDELQENQSIKNLVTVTFNRNLRITAYSYKNLETVTNKMTVEIFFCSTKNPQMFNVGNKIVKALKATNNYNIYTKNNFNSSSDPSSPYYIQGNQIRYNGADERKAATVIQQVIKKANGPAIDLKEARTVTPNYISIFFCEAYAASDIKQQAAY